MDTLALAENVGKVNFRREPPRDVVSAHCHSILADPEPEPASDDDPWLEERVGRLFVPPAEASRTGKVEKRPVVSEEHFMGSLSRSEVVGSLSKLGFEYAGERSFEFEALVDRYLGEKQSFSRSDVFALVTRLRAPTRLFGERLRTAAGRGDLRLVVEYLIRGCDVNTADGELQTSLHRACCQGRAEVIETMSSICGTKLLLDGRDRYGCSPLWLACLFGHEGCARKLIALGADVNAKTIQGKSCLHTAASRGHLMICSILIGAGASSQVDDLGMNPLHEATMKVRVNSQVVKLLSESYPDAMESADKLGYTPRDYLALMGVLENAVSFTSSSSSSTIPSLH